MKNNEEVKSRVLVTLTVQDLQILENLANIKEIDYIEIDRIINSMFGPEKKKLFEFQMDNDYGEIYDQVTRHLFLII